PAHVSEPTRAPGWRRRRGRGREPVRAVQLPHDPQPLAGDARVLPIGLNSLIQLDRDGVREVQHLVPPSGVDKRAGCPPIYRHLYITLDIDREQYRRRICAAYIETSRVLRRFDLCRGCRGTAFVLRGAVLLLEPLQFVTLVPQLLPEHGDFAGGADADLHAVPFHSEHPDEDVAGDDNALVYLPSQNQHRRVSFAIAGAFMADGPAFDPGLAPPISASGGSRCWWSSPGRDSEGRTPIASRGSSCRHPSPPA